MGMDKVIRYLIWVVLAVLAMTGIYTLLKNMGIV